MSEGNEEIKRGSDEDLYKRESLGDQREYGHSISKMAVAQICQGVGFETVKQSSLEALSRLLVQFISSLAKSATYNANLAGRSESNVFDVMKGLLDLSGGCSSSDSNNTGMANEMSEFVQVMEIPFGYSIPRFPVASRERKIQTPSFMQMGETLGNNQNHIPDWLPAFPDPHTYINSPLWNQRKSDIRIDKGEQARQRRKAERSLLNLQQRLLSNVFAGPSSSASVTNQSSALPSTNGSKDVKQNGRHFKKYVLVKQMFAPAIEALRGGGGIDAMDIIDGRVTPVLKRKKLVVHFKMKVGKKMLVQDLDVHLWSRLIGKRTSFVGRDDDKDDKKRRAQLILRQFSISNQEY